MKKLLDFPILHSLHWEQIQQQALLLTEDLYWSPVCSSSTHCQQMLWGKAFLTVEVMT